MISLYFKVINFTKYFKCWIFFREHIKAEKSNKMCSKEDECETLVNTTYGCGLTIQSKYGEIGSFYKVYFILIHSS